MAQLPRRGDPSGDRVPDCPDHPSRTIEQMADAGDIDAVVDFLSGDSGRGYSLAQIDQLLARAIDVASRRSPARFTDTVFARMSAFLFRVAMRLEGCANQCIEAADRDGLTQRGHLPAELSRAHLPAITQIARLLAELSQSWATTRRRWKLAQADRPRPRGRRKYQYRAGSPPQDVIGEVDAAEPDLHAGRGRRPR